MEIEEKEEEEEKKDYEEEKLESTPVVDVKKATKHLYEL